MYCRGNSNIKVGSISTLATYYQYQSYSQISITLPCLLYQENSNINTGDGNRLNDGSLSTLRLNLVLFHGIPPAFRDGVHFIIPSTTILSVPSLSGHANAYRWRSLPRARRHRASSPKGSSRNERVLPFRASHHGPTINNIRLSLPTPTRLLVQYSTVDMTCMHHVLYRKYRRQYLTSERNPACPWIIKR